MAAQLVAEYLQTVDSVSSTYWSWEKNSVPRFVILRNRGVDPYWSREGAVHSTKWLYITPTATRTLYPKMTGAAMLPVMAAVVYYMYTIHVDLADLKRQRARNLKRYELANKALNTYSIRTSEERMIRTLKKIIKA